MTEGESKSVGMPTKIDIHIRIVDFSGELVVEEWRAMAKEYVQLKGKKGRVCTASGVECVLYCIKGADNIELLCARS